MWNSTIDLCNKSAPGRTWSVSYISREEDGAEISTNVTASLLFSTRSEGYWIGIGNDGKGGKTNREIQGTQRKENALGQK